MICKKCGKEIDNASKFCEHCGAKMELKQKKKKSKRVILSVLSVIIVIILAYASRFLVLNNVANSIYDMYYNPNCFADIFLYDDYIDVNITDHYLKPTLFRLSNMTAQLQFYTDDNNYYYCNSVNYEEFSIYFDLDNVGYLDNDNNICDMNCNLNLDEGKVYKVTIEIWVSLYNPNNSVILNKIDNTMADILYIGTANFTSIDGYFLYENGEFIKVNQ